MKLSQCLLTLVLIPVLAGSAQAQEAWQRLARGRLDGRTAHLQADFQRGEVRLRVGKRNYNALARGEFKGEAMAFELRDSAGDAIQIELDPKQDPLKGSFYRQGERIGYFKERRRSKPKPLRKLRGSASAQVAQVRAEEAAHRKRLLRSLRALDKDLDAELEAINARLQKDPRDAQALAAMKEASARHATLRQNLFTATYTKQGVDPREKSGKDSPSANRPRGLEQFAARLRDVPAKSESERAEAAQLLAEFRTRFERERTLYRKGDYGALAFELEERVVTTAAPQAPREGRPAGAPAQAEAASPSAANGVANYLLERKKATEQASKSLGDALTGK